MTPTNINLTPTKYVGAVSLDKSPSLGSQAHTVRGNGPASLAPSLCSSTRKTNSGMDIRRTPDIKSRFIGFNRFVGFNFGQI